MGLRDVPPPLTSLVERDIRIQIFFDLKSKGSAQLAYFVYYAGLCAAVAMTRFTMALNCAGPASLAARR